MKIILESHHKLIQQLFTCTCETLKMSRLRFRPMHGRKMPVRKNVRSFCLAYTNLKTCLITIDIFTPRKRQPKKPSAILRIIAHEIAHYQKPPYRQKFRGRIINRQHYPAFYKQVNRNIEKIKEHAILNKYF